MLSYRDVSATLLTKHDKTAVIAPVLRDSLGITLDEYSQFDTDQLGTFTGTKARERSQIDTARYKAQLAATLGIHPIGLGSEGSFNSSAGLGVINSEVLVWYDKINNLTITAIANQWLMAEPQRIHSVDELQSYAKASGFPDQGLILRPDDGPDRCLFLDADTTEQLYAQFHQCVQQSPNDHVWIDCDFRAHRCPQRQTTLTLAAKDLCQRLSHYCPDCQKPGFGLLKAETGQPCSSCGAPTQQIFSYIHQCPHCDYQKRFMVSGMADPFHCQQCNP